MWLLDHTSRVVWDSILLPVVGSGLSALLQWSLVASFSLFQALAELNPVRFLALSLLSFNGNSFININNNLGTLLEIMLADEHLRTSITHITLVLGSYLK
jgi:hypothetical protein